MIEGNEKICYHYVYGVEGSCKYGDRCKFAHVNTQMPLTPAQKKASSPKSSSPQSVVSHETVETRDLVHRLAEETAKLTEAMRDTDRRMSETHQYLHEVGEQILQLTQYNSKRDSDLESQARTCVHNALVQRYDDVDESSVRVIIDMNGCKAVEWDGIFTVQSTDPTLQRSQYTLFVVEVKQSLEKEDVDQIQSRVDKTRLYITDTTSFAPETKLKTLRQLKAQRLLSMDDKDIPIRVIVGGMNITADMRRYIFSKGYAALFPNGINFSIAGM